MFGIQAKLFITLALVSLALLLTAAYVLYGLWLISNSSKIITEKEIPLTQGINGALLAMQEAKFSFEAALAVDSFPQIDEVEKREVNLKEHIAVFDAYLAAIAWGSETEAFKKSDGGRNFVEWQRLGLKDTLKIQPPPERRAQLAGITDIYFGGFAQNALKAIEAHKKFLAGEQGKTLQYKNAALHLSELAIGSLSQAVERSNISIAQSAENIEETQRNVKKSIIGIFAASLLAFFFSSLFLIRSNRVLEARNKELDRAAKALVKRDLEFSAVRRKQEDQLAELDRAAKALVRRDLALLQLNDELQEIDKAKSHFVSVAAHQLRTPLSIMKWTFRMLLSGDFGVLNEEQKNVIQRGYDVNEGTIKLISDLLDVARIESGRFSYDFEDVSMTDVVEKVLGMNALRAKEKRIKIKSVKESRGDIPPVRGDKYALEIALGNLISNAVNYTLPGGKVDVSYKHEKDFVEVRVKDTGVGVPRQQMSRLFTKFFRGDNVVRLQTAGTGLGLFIAHSVISAHNGTMGAVSQEGKGSEFWFKIPIKA